MVRRAGAVPKLDNDLAFAKLSSVLKNTESDMDKVRSVDPGKYKTMSAKDKRHQPDVKTLSEKKDMLMAMILSTPNRDGWCTFDDVRAVFFRLIDDNAELLTLLPGSKEEVPAY